MCQWEGSDNAPTLADNSFDGVECTAHHHGYGGMAGIMSVTTPLLGVNDLQLLLSTRAESAEDELLVY